MGMVFDGGKAAWHDGYRSVTAPRQILSYHDYTEWYFESFRDGAEHAMADQYSETVRKQRIENTKAIRAKFKAIKRTGE